METTVILIAHIIHMIQQLNFSMDRRNLWTLAAVVALLLKGKRAHLYELGRALPCQGNANSRVHKLRRWLSNPRLTPATCLPLLLRFAALLLAQCPEITLIIDRTEWQKMGLHINLFLCALAFHGRSLPIYWTLLPKRGCSSLADQKALLTPVFTALVAHPLLSQKRKKVLADREFCAPELATWISSFGIRFCIRVKQNYHVSRSDIPSTPISQFLKHCQPGQYYFFTNVLLTDVARLRVNLFLYWRVDCQEPLALITNIDEATALAESYRERMFMETLNRDLKSGGYDLERGKLTHAKRLTTLLIPLALAYILTIIQGDLEELQQPVPPLKKRQLSLFKKAKQRFADLFDRKSGYKVKKFFHQLFDFITEILLTPPVKNYFETLVCFAKKQRILLQ
jgi:hypothetical protein